MSAESDVAVIDDGGEDISEMVEDAWETDSARWQRGDRRITTGCSSLLNQLNMPVLMYTTCVVFCETVGQGRTVPGS